MNKEYKFYKCENNKEGSDYCFCQRPVDSNVSLRCFLENGEILGFMSESLVFKHPEIKEIDMNEFMYHFVRPQIKETNDLKQALIDIRELAKDNFTPTEMIGSFARTDTHEKNKLVNDILQIIDKVLGDEK